MDGATEKGGNEGEPPRCHGGVFQGKSRLSGACLGHLGGDIRRYS
jgi:hypothetical protein